MGKRIAPEEPLTPEALADYLRELPAGLRAWRSDRDLLYATLAWINTKATTDLTTEREAHAQPKAKLATAETNLTTEKAAHDKLKGEKDTKVQTEAARIAAANNHAPVVVPTAQKPGEVADGRSALHGRGRIAAAIAKDLPQLAERG